jgi:hypothetical protein
MRAQPLPSSENKRAPVDLLVLLHRRRLMRVLLVTEALHVSVFRQTILKSEPSVPRNSRLLELVFLGQKTGRFLFMTPAVVLIWDGAIRIRSRPAAERERAN